MKQKLGLVCTLIHEPALVILDEPTNSLDLKALHTFRKSIRKIALSGKSVILITHDIREIIPEISRVILLKDRRKYSKTERKKRS